MKKTRKRTLFYLFLALVLFALVFTACGQNEENNGDPEPPISGSEDDEETPLGNENPDITLDYLTSQYAQQLLDDGAELYFGSLELYETKDDRMMLILHEKERVADEGAPGGYRIVEYSALREFELPDYAEVLFLPGDATEHKHLTGEEFYDAYGQDIQEYSLDFEEYADFKFYDVYVIDDQAMLLISHYPA